MKCPFCGKTDIAEILYGMPFFSDKLQKELEEGRIILGGCCISENNPEYHCNNCSKDFPKINENDMV